jgi:hypothetical protein
VPVPPEKPGGREFTQFVSNHVFCNIDGHVLPAVMHRNGVTHHFGKNGGSPGPRLNNSFFSGSIHFVDSTKKPFLTKWSLF